MQLFAEELAAALPGTPWVPVGDTKRYSLFLVGSHTLVASHGMGCPSISILLHEVANLLRAGDVALSKTQWVRMGTCGGIGSEAGSLVLSTKAVDAALRPYQTITILGKEVRRPAPFDEGLRQELKDVCESLELAVVEGCTYCADGFYEEQARCDGAICTHTDKEKLAWLETCSEAGVRNIEMESLQFGSFTHSVGAKAAVLSVCFLDRLKGDTVSITKDQLKEYETMPCRVVIQHIVGSVSKAQAFEV